jgi:hypothetical protein
MKSVMKSRKTVFTVYIPRPKYWAQDRRPTTLTEQPKVGQTEQSLSNQRLIWHTWNWIGQPAWQWQYYNLFFLRMNNWLSMDGIEFSWYLRETHVTLKVTCVSLKCFVEYKCTDIPLTYFSVFLFATDDLTFRPYSSFIRSFDKMTCRSSSIFWHVTPCDLNFFIYFVKI